MDWLATMSMALVEERQSFWRGQWENERNCRQEKAHGCRAGETLIHATRFGEWWEQGKDAGRGPEEVSPGTSKPTNMHLQPVPEFSTR